MLVQLFVLKYLVAMNTFKEIAYKILREAGKPLHFKEITKIALKKGWLKTKGKTPEATMYAELIVDVNKNKSKSLFIKAAPSTFAINPDVKNEFKQVRRELTREVKQYKISKDISTWQKGDFAEARIAELITLYGDISLVCYKPISDDAGIDLIVKERKSLKTIYIQIKSRFGDNPDSTFTATVKASSVLDNYSMVLVFPYFDTMQGDLWDYLWLVPAPDFLKLATKLMGGKYLSFVAGRRQSQSNKWFKYLIDRRDLANKIIAKLKRV